MADDADDARQRAEAKLQKAQAVAREREEARAAYEAKAQANRANIARLKALRLEKQAADEEAPPAKAPASRRKAPPAKAPASRRKARST